MAEMEVDQIVHISDIKLPEGVESVALASDQDLTVAAIHVPKAAPIEDEAPEAPEGEDGEDGESSADGEASSDEGGGED